jgi:L-lactate dehydrogenase complex protein LldF
VRTSPDTAFPHAAGTALADTQLRHNLRHVTRAIHARRDAAVAEAPDWEALRDAGARITDEVLASLDAQLERLEASVAADGGIVHWARDGSEANAMAAGIVSANGFDEGVHGPHRLDVVVLRG